MSHLRVGPTRSCSRSSPPATTTAVAELYDRFARRVFGLGVHQLGSSALADELVQETFVRLWQSRGHRPIVTHLGCLTGCRRRGPFPEVWHGIESPAS